MNIYKVEYLAKGANWLGEIFCCEWDGITPSYTVEGIEILKLYSADRNRSISLSSTTNAWKLLKMAMTHANTSGLTSFVSGNFTVTLLPPQSAEKVTKKSKEYVPDEFRADIMNITKTLCR